MNEDRETDGGKKIGRILKRDGDGGQGKSTAESLRGINRTKADTLTKAHTPAAKLYKQEHTQLIQPYMHIHFFFHLTQTHRLMHTHTPPHTHTHTHTPPLCGL